MARTELVLLFVHGRDIDGAAQGLMLHKDTGIVILSPATADATTNKKRNHEVASSLYLHGQGTWQLICSWWPSAMATPTALNGDNHNA
uniref:Uncharacterized protein n=1 Tax=Oryza glaberrima TaxID=4538 RepID=I1Q9H5_ORYGL